MKSTSVLALALSAAAVIAVASCATQPKRVEPAASVTTSQAPSWTAEDTQFFLHGTMSTEFAPETVLRAFVRVYPDLFPSSDLTHIGLIPDPQFGWPVGFSRREVQHLGGLSSVGVNCAACHVVELTPTSGGGPVRVLGATSHFDAEAFFGAVITATFRTADPKNMQPVLAAFLDESDPQPDSQRRGTRRDMFHAAWRAQESKIVAAMAEDPTGAKLAGPGGLNSIAPVSLRLDGPMLVSGVDLAALSQSMLRLFHNMRAALHVPDQPPEKLPPPSGPGRNDAFGLLSAILFNSPQPYSPVKYGLLWNLDKRQWVHWDGNTKSPVGRNVLASLGLGAPLIGKHGKFDFAMIDRQTTLSEQIRAPKYPFAIDNRAARSGETHYRSQCASCHDGPEDDSRLHAVDAVGTEPTRARAFTPEQATLFNRFLASLESPGYQPPSEPGLRGTGKYWASSMAGVWARSPYLHNGSVRTMNDLLTAPSSRPPSFRRGSRSFDTTQMGYADEGAYLFDTRSPGNGNAGHDYGTNLSAEQKRDLIEFLKTL